MYAPLLYGAWVLRCARHDPAVLEAATRVFFVLAPVIGIYGVWQYVSPPELGPLLDAQCFQHHLGAREGRAVPGAGVQHDELPASFGTYAACGVLMLGFCRRGWQALLLALLVAPGLLFTYYRTAWISLALGIGYCAMFSRTRERAGLIAVVIVAATALAAFNADFGDAVMDRIGSLTGSVSEDGSGKARLGQLFEVYRLSEDMVVGRGFAQLATPFNGIDAADGEVVTAIIAMGVPVGCIYLIGLVWAGVQALGRVRHSRDPRLIVTGAVIAGCWRRSRSRA